MFIFEKDENGKLHQTDLTLAQVKEKGKRVSVSIVQCYVMSTDAEDIEFNAAQEAALARAKEEDAKREANKIAAREREAQEAARIVDIKAAQTEAEQAKNHALVLALQQIEELNNKLKALTSEKQPL